jgi:hypothetical protein
MKSIKRRLNDETDKVDFESPIRNPVKMKKKEIEIPSSKNNKAVKIRDMKKNEDTVGLLDRILVPLPSADTSVDKVR